MPVITASTLSNAMDLRQKINFKQLRCFHAVVQKGSFTAAARALFVGQPSITTHIKALEQRFGIELFCRHGHHVELTDTGRRLSEITQRIFSLETEAAETMRAASGCHVGQLRIGAIGPTQITEVIVAFGRHYSEVELSVSLGNTQEVLAGLFAFRSDVAILPRPDEDARLHSLALGHNRIVLLVGRDHPWSTRSSVSIDELGGQRMVLREHGSATRKEFEDALAAADVEIRPVLEIESREAVAEAVAAGIGIGIALEEDTHPDDRIHPLRVNDAELFLKLHLTCLEERKGSPLIKAFFGIVTAMHDTAGTTE